MFFLDFGLILTLLQLLVELNSFFINLVETPIHSCALLHFYWRLSWGWKWKEFTLTHKMLSCLKNLELKKLKQVKKNVFTYKDHKISWLTAGFTLMLMLTCLFWCLCLCWHVYCDGKRRESIIRERSNDSNDRAPDNNHISPLRRTVMLQQRGAQITGNIQ